MFDIFSFFRQEKSIFGRAKKSYIPAFGRHPDAVETDGTIYILGDKVKTYLDGYKHEFYIQDISEIEDGFYFKVHNEFNKLVWVHSKYFRKLSISELAAWRINNGGT